MIFPRDIRGLELKDSKESLYPAGEAQWVKGSVVGRDLNKLNCSTAVMQLFSSNWIHI